MKNLIVTVVSILSLLGCAGNNLTGNKLLPDTVGEPGLPRYCTDTKYTMENRIVLEPDIYKLNGDDTLHVAIPNWWIQDLEWAKRIRFTTLAIDSNCIINQSIQKTFSNPSRMKVFNFDLKYEPKSYIYYRWSMDY